VSTLQYFFKFNSDGDRLQATIDKIDQKLGKAEEKAKKFGASFKKGIDGINKKLGSLQMNAMIQNIQFAAQGLESLNRPAIALDASLKDLQAITGVNEKQLKNLSNAARESAKIFGVDASQGVESYKLLLSQLSPELVKAPKALQAMGDNVAILSKTMANDQSAATAVLTTAMNQYQVSLTDPVAAQKEMARMMNIMAAAAKEGSAELPQQQAALEQSGMAAKQASLEFQEHAAAIQVLDKAGKKGSEGGVALRNSLSILSTGRFLPPAVRKELAAAGVDINTLGNTSLKFTDRLRPLKKIMNDSALMTKLFGRENKNAAMALISSVDEQDRLSKAIVGTNTAREQANIVMESQAEKNARLKAKIDDFKISLNNATGGILSYANVLGGVAFDISNLLPLIGGMGKAIMFVTSAQKMYALWTGIVSVATTIWTGVQWALNAALSPILIIPAIIVAIGAAIVYVISKTEGWGKAWDETVGGAKLLFKTFVGAVKLYFQTMVTAVMMGINKIKKGWYQFKEAVGLGDSSENKSMIAAIDADTEARKQALLNAAKEVRDNGIAAMKKFKTGAESIKWKVEKEGDETEGIEGGLFGGLTNSGNNTAPAAGDSEIQKSNTAIATGGSKSKTINITLQNLVGNLKIEGSSFKETAKELEQNTIDALARVLASAASASN
jgi:TP901 family phage tail tape measure protein